jgi:peptidoglycan/xylan/chitin deacetylase (PgdA/CDA1 family)
MIALALWLILGGPRVLAHGPTGHEASASVSTNTDLPGHPCLCTGDDGPVFSIEDLARRYRQRRVATLEVTHAPQLTEGPTGKTFTIDDLRSYTPPKPIPPVRPHPPLFTREYPALLQQVPREASVYSPTTIETLAHHEIRSGDPESGYVALTFDCEIYPKHVLSILQTLREENVRATFFVLGQFAYNFPAVIQQMVADGHEIGNHSFFHPFFTEISPLQATNEITYTEAAISWAVGHWTPMRYFRFPGAYRDAATRQLVASLGYQSVYWSVDAQEWSAGKTDAEVLATIQKQTRSGSIVLLHCREIGARILPAVLESIRAKGLSPGTVTDVLSETDRVVLGDP